MFALNAALLFNLGATVGAFTLETAMLSRLLCPGTPSNVLSFDFTLGLVGVVTGACPSLNAAAFVILGATVGGAVDAT